MTRGTRVSRGPDPQPGITTNLRLPNSTRSLNIRVMDAMLKMGKIDIATLEQAYAGEA